MKAGKTSAALKRRVSQFSAIMSRTPTTSSGRQGRSSSAARPSMDSGVPAMMLSAPLDMSQPVDARKPAITWKGMKRTMRATPKRSISR